MPSSTLSPYNLGSKHKWAKMRAISMFMWMNLPGLMMRKNMKMAKVVPTKMMRMTEAKPVIALVVDFTLGSKVGIGLGVGVVGGG
jgi:hypothetical protein